MIECLRRALQRLARGHYRGHHGIPSATLTRPTPRRERAAIALRRLPDAHPDHGLLMDYVDGMTIEAIGASWHMSESTVNRRINRMLQ